MYRLDKRISVLLVDIAKLFIINLKESCFKQFQLLSYSTMCPFANFFFEGHREGRESPTWIFISSGPEVAHQNVSIHFTTSSCCAVGNFGNDGTTPSSSSKMTTWAPCYALQKRKPEPGGTACRQATLVLACHGALFLISQCSTKWICCKMFWNILIGHFRAGWNENSGGGSLPSRWPSKKKCSMLT